MKKRVSVLLCLALALVLSMASLSVGAESSDIGLEAQFASSWQNYSVRSNQSLMLILTVHADLELASFRRADSGEALPWSPSITRTMTNNDDVVTERTWVIVIDKAEADLDVIVTFSDGSEYPIPHELEVTGKEADGSLLGTWSGSSYGGNWYFRFTEDTLRMVHSEDAGDLDREGKYTELKLLWRESGTVWILITDENRLPILEMNEKPTTAVLEGKEVTAVPLAYTAGSSGASLTYDSTYHGQQTIRLTKTAD